MSDRPDAASGENPSPMSIAAVTATGCAEPGSALEERAEREGNEQQLDPPVIREVADRSLQALEVALIVGQIVEENDVEDDPADRQQPEGRAIGRGHARHMRRHAEAEDSDGERRDQPEDRGVVGLDLEERDGPQEYEHGNGGNERREHHVAKRIVDL